MFQIFAGPQDATDKQNMMSLSNVLDSILFNFGEPVTIRKASTASPKASDRLKADKEFLVHLELQDYQPEEVKITADNHQVTVTAKHGQRPDNFGYVSRKITRVINLPEDVDPTSVTSIMNSNGILVIRAKKHIPEMLQ